MVTSPSSKNVTCDMEQPKTDVSAFASLSNDICVEIFQCLTPIDEARMGMVDRRFNAVFCDKRKPAIQRQLAEKLRLISLSVGDTKHAGNESSHVDVGERLVEQRRWVRK